MTLPTDDEIEPIQPVWCAVANIVLERDYGPGGEQKRSGTKHFPPGAKVFILSFFWGMGGEQVTIVGRHRGSHRYVSMTIATKWLANWRAELVYSPHLIQKIQQAWEYDRNDPGGEAARQNAERIAAMWQQAGAKTQPFLSRQALPNSEDSDHD